LAEEKLIRVRFTLNVSSLRGDGFPSPRMRLQNKTVRAKFEPLALYVNGSYIFTAKKQADQKQIGNSTKKPICLRNSL
jgi:hypothetical protein